MSKCLSINEDFEEAAYLALKPLCAFRLCVVECACVVTYSVNGGWRNGNSPLTQWTRLDATRQCRRCAHAHSEPVAQEVGCARKCVRTAHDATYHSIEMGDYAIAARVRKKQAMIVAALQQVEPEIATECRKIN